MLTQLLTETREQSVALTEIVTDLKHVKEKVETLETYVVTGNGSPSLLVRIDRLEQSRLGKMKRAGAWTLYTVMTVSGILAAVVTGVVEFFVMH